MPRLEYRMLSEGYPVLHFYRDIGREEIAMRFACDYLVKDRTVYETTSCAVESGTFVIYVNAAEDEQAATAAAEPPNWKGIRLELRQFREGTEYHPLVDTYDFGDGMEVLLRLQSRYLYRGAAEWEKTSAEVDEDRKVYVFYAQEVCKNDGNE